MLAAVPDWAVEVGTGAGVALAVLGLLQVLGFPVTKAVRILLWPVRATWKAVIVEPLAGWFRDQVKTVVDPELKSISAAINHQPPGEPSMAAQVMEIRETVRPLPGRLDALAAETDRKHEENAGAIEAVSHSAARLWVVLDELERIVFTLGRALGMNLPEPPPRHPPTTGGT